MTSFETPPLYLAIHVISGMISYFYPILIVLIIAYQLLQWILGCRFFLFSWQIKQGNSLEYTLYKIMQYVVGYSAVYSYEKLKPKPHVPNKE
jgi:hypothetical protein